MIRKNLLINFILFLISGIFPVLLFWLCCIWFEIGFILMFAFLIMIVAPVSIGLLLIAVYIKNKTEIRKRISVFLGFNSLWWLIFFVLFVPISSVINDTKEQKIKQPYNNIIKELDSYKSSHKVYPTKLEQLNITKEQIPEDIEYELYNNNQDFELEFRSGFGKYNIYCSNENIDDFCKEGKYGSIQVNKSDDGWLYYDND